MGSGVTRHRRRTMNNAAQVAKVLFNELGEDDALKYADRIAMSNGPLAAEYAEAARIIRNQRRCK